MKKIIVLLLIFLLPTVLFAQINQNRPIVFKRVTVIDVKNGAAKSDMTVIVTSNRISAVGKTGKIKIPKDAEIIDASGKFLIPGLWDMHSHALNNDYEWIFPLLIANGVTGVRELGSRLPFERINEVRREILEGKILGPRVGATTARILDGKGSAIIPQVEVETEEQARRLVREYKRQGMNFIKPYNLLSRELYLAIVDEAKRQKIAVAGHVPFSMTAAEVSDLGQITIEHFSDIFVSCSRDEAQIRQEQKQLLESSKTGQFRPIMTQARAIATYDERKAAALAALLARNGTWWSPTIFLSGTHPAERPRSGDSRLKYIPAPIQERWRNDARQRPGVVPTAEESKMRDRVKLEIVGVMHRTGVRLLAGTDIINPYVYPGFSLHDELELFVQAGLTPLAALQTATINPAKFLGKENELGTIEKGKFADLVLLEANPLENIRNTTKITAVVANGRFFSKQDVEKLLSDVEKTNSQKQALMFDFLKPSPSEFSFQTEDICD